MSWRDDNGFVAALESHRHARRAEDGDLELYLAERVVQYMHDFWLEGIAHATPEPEEDAEQEPPPAVLERARRLQALALDEGAGDQERQNAWNAFERIWKRYKLPVDFGVS